MLLETPHSHRSIMPPVSSARISTCSEALTQSLLRTLRAGKAKISFIHLLYALFKPWDLRGMASQPI